MSPKILYLELFSYKILGTSFEIRWLKSEHVKGRFIFTEVPFLLSGSTSLIGA